jgi:hypothetical protein
LRIQIIAARDPVWANEEHTSINCWLRTSLWEDELPFNATPDDIEDHGRELFWRCVKGEFGPVGPFYPPGHPKNVNYSLPGRGFVFPENSPPASNWVEKWPEVQDFLNEANVENARGTVRGIALVWGAMLEDMLNRFVDSELGTRKLRRADVRRPNLKHYKETFADTIQLALDQDFISENLANDLNSVRKVRNCCAHEWRLDLSNHKVIELLPLFESLRTKYVPGLLTTDDLEVFIKMVFAEVCLLLIIYFADRLP